MVRARRLKLGTSSLNPLTPNDLYMSRTAPLTSKCCILYIYSTNVGTEYFKHALYSPVFFSSKCSSFRNANFYASCSIHILYTGCAEIKKNNSGAKGLIAKTIGEFSVLESNLEFKILWRQVSWLCWQNSSESAAEDDASIGESRYHRRLQLMLRALFAVSGEALRGRFLSQQLLVKVLIFLFIWDYVDSKRFQW